MCEGVLFVLLGSPDQIGFFVDVGKEGRKEKGGTASTPRMLKSETYTLLHGKKTHTQTNFKKKNFETTYSLIRPHQVWERFSVYLAYSNLAGIFDVAGTAEGARAAES